MRFTYENPEFEAAIRDAATPEALSQAMERLNTLIRTFFEPGVYGRRLHAGGLDSLVPLITERLGLRDVPLTKSNDNICVLATRFYRTGGHSQVAADIMRAMGAERTTLIFTDIFRHFRYPTRPGLDLSKQSHPCRSWLILSAPTFAERIVELYMQLAAIRPSRIFLLGNHMDMVAVAGCWPFRSVVDFIHHADCQPALGATLPYSAHVDLTFGCHLACQEAGLDPIYASMKPPTQAATSAVASERTGPLIATCGHQHKYRKPARRRWTDYAIAALQGAANSRILHIGPTDDDFVAEVRAALAAAGLDPQRYEFRGVAPLQAELVSRDVDVYLSSYPEHGGRANLEAMMTGRPCIAPVDAEAPPLIVDWFPLPQFHKVNEPSELQGLIGQAPALRAQAESADAMAALDREVRRFDDYLAGSPLEPVGAAMRLPETSAGALSS